MVIAGPFLTHATIRAARVRETGDWRPGRHGGTARQGMPVSMSTLAAATPYTAPLGLMDALQVTILVLVAAGATGVVLIRDPVRQVSR